MARSPRTWTSGTIVLTDYPFTELHDPPGAPAPTRKVTFISYDKNKYATIRLPDGTLTTVKAGYLMPLGTDPVAPRDSGKWVPKTVPEGGAQ